jgi:hypothetical protein
LYPENEDTANLPNVMNHSLSRTSPHLIQPESTTTNLAETEIPDYNSSVDSFGILQCKNVSAD